MKILTFLVRLFLVLLMVTFGAPVILYREFKWRRSPEYAFAKKIQAMEAQYLQEVQQAIEPNAHPRKNFHIAAKIGNRECFREYIQQKTSYLSMMDACMLLLPVPVFRKNEGVLAYFIQMAHGLITGQYNEQPTSMMFRQVQTVEDLLCVLIKMRLMTEATFKEHFQNVDEVSIKTYLSHRIDNYQDLPQEYRQYREPGPCG